MIAKIKEWLTPLVCDSQLDKVEELKRLLNYQVERNLECVSVIHKKESVIEVLETSIDALEMELESLGVINEVDVFCQGVYADVSNRAYTNKRGDSKFSYDAYINEFIQPDSFEVERFRHRNASLWDDATSKYDKIRSVAQQVNRQVTYTSDMNLHNSVDYYQTPSETLAARKGDCEDFAFLLSSLFPEELGVAYGFYSTKDGRRIGHAFNVFVWNGELWLVDTSTPLLQLHRYASNKHSYKIHFIITPKHTYVLEMGVEFGRIAGWN